MKKPRKPARRILTVDVGGSHVKFEVSTGSERREFVSGPKLSAKAMVATVRAMTQDWAYDVVSIGYPGVVAHDRITREPRNLGRGWKDFDFAKAFGCPVKVVNDALMQAAGSYQGGRMLFLGLGTGLGTAMIADGILMPMEAAHLPYRKGKSFEYYAGAAGLNRSGKKRWRKHVRAIIAMLVAALQPDYVVLGGGNAKKFGRRPDNVRRGDNDNAFTGGYRLWANLGGTGKPDSA
jgi:polyphosphate glucokinase